MIKGVSEKEINEQIKKLAVLDSLIPFRKATRFMGLINLGFAISWFLRDKSISNIRDFRYIVLYIYMFLVSFAFILFCLILRSRARKAIKRFIMPRRPIRLL